MTLLTTEQLYLERSLKNTRTHSFGQEEEGQYAAAAHPANYYQKYVVKA